MSLLTGALFTALVATTASTPTQSPWPTNSPWNPSGTAWPPEDGDGSAPEPASVPVPEPEAALVQTVTPRRTVTPISFPGIEPLAPTTDLFDNTPDTHTKKTFAFTIDITGTLTPAVKDRILAVIMSQLQALVGRVVAVRVLFNGVPVRRRESAEVTVETVSESADAAAAATSGLQSYVQSSSFAADVAVPGVTVSGVHEVVSSPPPPPPDPVSPPPPSPEAPVPVPEDKGSDTNLYALFVLLLIPIIIVIVIIVYCVIKKRRGPPIASKPTDAGGYESGGGDQELKEVQPASGGYSSAPAAQYDSTNPPA